MDTRREFLDILQDYIDFPVDKIETDAPLKAASGIDSFSFIEIIASVEEHFGITIPNCDLAGFRRIDDIIAYIAKKTA